MIFATITLLLDVVAYAAYGHMGVFTSKSPDSKVWQYLMKIAGVLFLLFGGWAVYNVLT